MKYFILSVLFMGFFLGCKTRDSEHTKLKSGYSSDYPLWSDKLTNGPVTVIRKLQKDHGIGLLVIYRGQLATKKNLNEQTLKMYIKLLYQGGSRDGTFTMADAFNSQNDRPAAIFILSNACLVGVYGGCGEESTDQMKDLLFWTKQPDDTLNALTLEIAFVDSDNNWDSRFGQNYRFDFDQKDF